MSAREFSGDLPEKKLRFRPTPKIHYTNENKVEDLLRTTEFKSKWDDNRGTSENDEVKLKKDTQQPSLLQFLGVELTRGYMLEHDKEKYSARREKVYSFMKIPREVEKFMAYGFFQCADSFLFVYTFLPMRFILALWTVISRFILECFGIKKSKSKSFLKPAEICDLLKACILIACSMMMSYIDTSMMYHLVKSQSVIKLYIFYNMLEVGDRLFSAFGQDTIDALFWTATEPRDRRREHLGVIPHLFFAVAYVFLHSILVLFQATTLNVAINSNNKALLTIMMSNNVFHSVVVLLQATTLNVAINSNNKALLTIMMSNNFIELKGSVFKKFDKNNLFQVSCSDVRERFHLFVLHFIVVLQTMKEYSWKEERFWVLVPDCFMVLFAEVLVDWIKHAFITRFNELPVDVYRDYTISLAYDMAQTRQKYAFSDHSDLVARRMGFIPLPLGVVMVRVLGHALHLEGPPAFILLIIAYLCLASLRVLNSIVILGKACDLITQHQQDKAAAAASPAWSRATSPVNGRPVNHTQSSVVRDLSKEMRDATPESIRHNIPLQRSVTVPAVSLTDEKEDPTEEKPPECTLGPAAIFSNSAVSINNVCLNPELFDKPEDMEVVEEKDISGVTDLDDGKTRSVPNILANVDSETKDSFSQEISPMFANEDFVKKRAESEPSIPHLVESERTGNSPP